MDNAQFGRWNRFLCSSLVCLADNKISAARKVPAAQWAGTDAVVLAICPPRLHYRYVVAERRAGATPFLLCIQLRWFLPKRRPATLFMLRVGSTLSMTPVPRIETDGSDSVALLRNCHCRVAFKKENNRRVCRTHCTFLNVCFVSHIAESVVYT